ncbi:TPA: hypothetical protein ACKJ8L_001192 [Neisseria gonorrhoeae]|nr:hypothetical protein M782_02455 [Neisseria gonorrhoeae MU_NG17]UWT16358.1 hypothetical protein NC850_01440 [Neisseria gonorrhoeae]
MIKQSHKTVITRFENDKNANEKPQVLSETTANFPSSFPQKRESKDKKPQKFIGKNRTTKTGFPSSLE